MLGKKLNEMNPAEVQLTDTIVQRTLDRLSVMYAGVSERGIKALFLINGGGIVTMLAYFHEPSVEKNILLFLSFVCFLLGLMLTVILVGIDYYIGMKFLNNYSSNIKNLTMEKLNCQKHKIIQVIV